MHPNDRPETALRRRSTKGQLKAYFLRNHPICCFCGEAASEEPDHCPARICFRGKEGPEDWIFPACAACNRAISGTEQLTAFYIRTLDFTDDNYREADLARLIAATHNNHPDLFPDVTMSAREKRRMLQHLGHKVPKGAFLDDVPIMAMPKGIDPYFRYFARKLTAAVFYRFHGRPVTGHHLWMCHWFPSYDEGLQILLDEFSGAWNHLMVGARGNIDFGDQFAVLAATSRDDDVISFIAQFGSSLCFWCGVGKPSREDLGQAWTPYRPIKDGL